MFDWIYSGMGWILRQIYELLNQIGIGYYALAILLFTILVTVVFLPLTMKQQRASAKQASLRPKLEALKEKCGDDQRRYQTEMQALYRKENVSMMGGCWTMLVRLPFLWGVWMAIRSPLTYILGIEKTVIDNAATALKIAENAADKELIIVQKINELGAGFDGLKDQVLGMNFNLFGLNLTEIPTFSLNFSTVDWIWLIPILSFATAMLSSVVTMNMQKKTNPQAGNMGCMMLGMPIISLVIAFGMPGAVGFYWACSNLVNMVVQICMNKYYGPHTVLAKDAAKTVAVRKGKELALKEQQ